MANACKIFIHNLRLEAVIGIHPHEQKQPQPLLISVELEQRTIPADDNLSNTFCYDALAKKINLIAKQKFNLAETLAKAIADDCLADERILSARVSVKKPNALADADEAGVEIFCQKGLD